MGEKTWAVITGTCCAVFWWVAMWHYTPNVNHERLAITTAVVFVVFGLVFYGTQRMGRN